MGIRGLQYSVFVATDCNGSKVNLRFLFDSHGPSVAQLLHRSVVAFNNFFHIFHIRGTFAFNAAVVFNDVSQRWDRLERSTQLLHNSQVYLFQPDILDLPAEIQEPFEALPLLGDGYVSPEREAIDSPRAPTPLCYDPRPSFTYESPRMMRTPPDYKRKAEAANTRKTWISDSATSHYYNVRDDVMHDGSRSASLTAARRCNGESSLANNDAISTCRKMNCMSLSSSPLPEQPHNSRHFPSGDRSSIIRDEREKIEYQWRLSLDEMRQTLKEETRQLERSISPVGRVL